MSSPKSYSGVLGGHTWPCENVIWIFAATLGPNVAI